MRDHDMAAACRSSGQHRSARHRILPTRSAESSYSRPQERQPAGGVGACSARTMCATWCELPGKSRTLTDEPPRLYVVTRNAQNVLPGDVANLEQAGLRGLVRAVGTEYPHLRATQVDMDEDSEAEQLARQLLGNSEEDETAWRNGQWYTARLSPAPLRPEERRTAVVNNQHDGLRRSARPATWKRWNSLVSTRSAGARRDRSQGERIRHQFRGCPVGARPASQHRRGCTPARYGFCRRGDRGRFRRDNSSVRATTSAASPQTVAGPRSSHVTPVWP